MTRAGLLILAGWYALFLLLLLIVAGPRPVHAAMEHEEIVARLATGQRVPGYDTRAFRKQRRIARGVRR